MDTFDLVLLWVITAAAFAVVPMRVKLAEKQGSPQSLGWTVQELVFPVLLLVALILYMTGIADVVFPAVAIGLLEEIICSVIRRRNKK